MSNISKISLGGEVYDITLTQEKFNALLKGGSPGLTYEISEDGTYATCTGIGGCTDTNIVIASEYAGKPVTSIGDYAFETCYALTSITIPDSITSIGDSAFNWCESLKSVTIGNGVTSIGNYAFDSCSSLESIEIPDHVTSIGYQAFQNCCPTSITLPFVGATKDGTENTHFGYIFGASSYSENSSYVPSSLKTVIITGGTSIGYCAFYDCTSLESITIPNSVTSFGEGAFRHCISLMSVTISDSVTSIGKGAFDYCESLKSITIPASVTYISDEAFLGCSSLTSITIPDSVTSIGSSAFDGCSSLKSIVIPNSVTTIDDGAFYDCENLNSITIPDSVTRIGGHVFHNCTGLTSVTIPDSVAGIGEWAFAECRNLTIYCEAEEQPENWDQDWNTSNCIVVWGYAPDIPAINDKLNTILADKTDLPGSEGLAYELSADETYAICTGLGTCTETDIVIASTYQDKPVTLIRASAFDGCSNLTSITIPDSVTSIGSCVFFNCTNLTSVVIGNGVTSISEEAFWGCSSLTSITIPNSVTSIGSGAFYNCSNLTSVTIPDSVTTMGYGAFQLCESLTSVTIGNGVTTIGAGAFDGCISLTSVIIPDSVTSIGGSAFQTCSSLTNITIPFVGAEKDGTSNTHFGYIFGASTYEDNSSYVPASLKNVIITGGSSISENAFCGCTSLTSITIPNSVTTIGLDCLRGCSNLVELSIPFVGPYLDAGYSADEYTFVNCHLGYLFGTTDGEMETMPEYVPSSLTTLHITNGTIIGVYCACMCSQIQTITLPKTLKRIEEGAFQQCSAISNIEFPETLTSIGSYSFYMCENLSSIKFPNSLQKIEEGAFGESGLTHIEFPMTLEYIGDDAFSGCALTNVNFPYYIKYLSGFSGCAFETRPYISNAEVIGANAFESCTGLGELWFDSVHTIGESAFAYSDISGINTAAKNIGDFAFQGCTHLTSASLSNYTGETGKAMFQDCTQLTSITYGGSLQVIPKDFCYGCSQLRYFQFNDYYGGSQFSITDIKDGAFRGCTQLSSSVNTLFSNTLRFIGDDAFNGCTNLEAPLYLATSLQYIGRQAFYGATIATLPQDSSNSFKVPNSVIRIYDEAFAGSNLTKVYIPDTVYSLGENIFDNTVVCYCEAPYQPYYWDAQWNSGGTVYWGAAVGASSHLPIITDDVLVGAILIVALDDEGNKIWKIQNPPTEVYTGEVE